MNNSVYQHYQGYEFLIRKLEEGITRYERNYIPVVYGFLGVDELKVAETYTIEIRDMINEFQNAKIQGKAMEHNTNE